MHVSKWKKEIIIRKNLALSPYLPQSIPYSTKRLREFLNRYPVVFVKPSYGTGGRNIVKIIRNSIHYLFQVDGLSKKVDNFEDLKEIVQSFLNGKKYILQEGIDLLTINGRPIDFRVLLLKPKNNWEFMGVMAKQARENAFVTNFSRGGKPMSLKEVILNSSTFNKDEEEEVESQLLTLGNDAANTLNKAFPSLRKLGIDVGIDSKKQYWIFDLNFAPRFKLFKYHPDPKLYRKIYEQLP